MMLTRSTTSCVTAPTIAGMKPNAATTINTRLNPMPSQMLCTATLIVRWPMATSSATLLRSSVITTSSADWVYDEEEAHRLAAGRGWTVKQDGDSWRRVVSSPTPIRVVETRLIRLLLDSGAVVVCAGGGGVPVIRNEAGRLEGVEAVVDKDLATSVLAEALDADVLMVLTDVPHVMRGFGTDRSEPILRASAVALRREEFAAGSMGPKVDAVCRFVEVTGGMAAIGRFEDVSQILAAEAGTIVTPDGRYDGLADLSSSAQRSLGVRRG